jgi:[ribosomal protein S5]-alanine N-acetyltransferase
MIYIKTSRLVIRNFKVDDWKDFQEILIYKESSEYAIYDYQFPTSDNEVKGMADKFAKGNKFLAICELTDNKVIGYICLNGKNDKELELGYTFNSTYQGKGYATEACIAVINYAFNNLHVEKLTIGTANLNYPSCRLINRLGFRKISECICSFRKTPEGNPIEFVDSLFLLEKDEWMKKDYSGIK